MTMKKAISVLLTALLLLGLSVPAFAASVYESYRIPSGSMRMIAHTGYSAVAPGNTIQFLRMKQPEKAISGALSVTFSEPKTAYGS